jgi:hypothetical protein
MSGEMAVETKDAEERKDDKIKSKYSTTDPGMAQAVGLSRAPKEERAIAASFGARVAAARRCRIDPGRPSRNTIKGPTFLQTTPRRIYESSYKVTLVFKSHLQHRKSRHGSPPVAATLGHPLGGFGEAAPNRPFLRHRQG